MPSFISRRAWVVFALIVAADVLDLLSITVTNVAAPAIVGDLGAGDSLAPWLGASYPLAMGSLLIVGGRLGDRFGYRRLFLLGVAGFTLGALLSAAAPGPVWLVAARAGQGAAGGLLIPQGFSLLVRLFPREAMGRVFGLFGPLIAVSSISGPVLAGLLIDADPLGLGWRSVFLITAGLGVAVVGVGAVVVPPFPGDAEARVEPGPALHLATGIALVLAGLVDHAVLALAGAAVLAVFARRQATTARPLLERSLFANRSFVAGLLFGALFFGTVTGLLYVTTLHLQQRLGLPPFQAALLTAPVSVGIIVTSFAVRRHVVGHGRLVVAAGVALFGAGVLAMTIVVATHPRPVGLLVAPLFVAGLGMGCCFGSIFAVALGDVTPEQAGSASGVLNAVQQIVNAVGGAAVATLYLSTGGGLLPCLALTLVATAACAAAVPLLPHRGADVH